MERLVGGDLGEPNRRFPWIGARGGLEAELGGGDFGGLGVDVFFCGEVRARRAPAVAGGSVHKSAKFRE